MNGVAAQVIEMSISELEKAQKMVTREIVILRETLHELNGHKPSVTIVPKEKEYKDYRTEGITKRASARRDRVHEMMLHYLYRHPRTLGTTMIEALKLSRQGHAWLKQLERAGKVVQTNPGNAKYRRWDLSDNERNRIAQVKTSGKASAFGSRARIGGTK